MWRGSSCNGCAVSAHGKDTARNVALFFAVGLATSCHRPCHFLPFLPPITRNVKLPIPANPLEFRCEPDQCRESNAKSGKNGNVHRPTQHCRAGFLWQGRCLVERRRESTVYKYRMNVWWSEEDQAFLVEMPKLPGAMAAGATPEEAVRR